MIDNNEIEKRLASALNAAAPDMLDDLMAELKGLGFRFWFSEKGGRVSKGETAWFLKK